VDDNWKSWWTGEALREPQKQSKEQEVIDYWGFSLDAQLSYHSNAAPETLRDELIKWFRRGSQPLDLGSMLADMLDPAGKSYWRLELRRRRRGSPGRLSVADHMYLAHQYESRLEDLRQKNRASAW
jgi:hypothetical protein